MRAINTMSSGRILAAVILLATPFGCGDDDIGDDGGVTDSRELPEGGGYRVEFLEWGSSVAGAFLGIEPEGDRLFFNDTELILYKDQTPAIRGWLPPRIDVGRELPDGSICYKTAGLYSYWVSTVPEQQAVLDTRTYLDMGDTVKLSGPDGFSLDLSRIDGGVSPLQGLVHGNIYLPTMEELLPADRIPEGWFDIVPEQLPEDLPEFAPTNGISMWHGDPVERFGAYRPRSWSMGYPVDTDFMQRGVAFNSEEDFVFTMNAPAQPADGGEYTKMLGLITVENGIIIDTICLNNNTENDTLTIPKEVLKDFTNGVISINYHSSTIYEYDGRQFYATGFSCLASGFCVDDPGATDGVCSPPAAQRLSTQLSGMDLRPEAFALPAAAALGR